MITKTKTMIVIEAATATRTSNRLNARTMIQDKIFKKQEQKQKQKQKRECDKKKLCNNLFFIITVHIKSVKKIPDRLDNYNTILSPHGSGAPRAGAAGGNMFILRHGLARSYIEGASCMCVCVCVCVSRFRKVAFLRSTRGDGVSRRQVRMRKGLLHAHVRGELMEISVLGASICYVRPRGKNEGEMTLFSAEICPVCNEQVKADKFEGMNVCAQVDFICTPEIRPGGGLF
jgi:hypothetical protein